MCVCATDGSVDFMTHYRLVNPTNLEGYARAFVVGGPGPGHRHQPSGQSARPIGPLFLSPVTAGKESKSEAGVVLTDPRLRRVKRSRARLGSVLTDLGHGVVTRSRARLGSVLLTKVMGGSRYRELGWGHSY